MNTTPLNLKKFESLVESKILGRGVSYYESDSIGFVDQVEEGEFCAEVTGTEVYNVFVKLNKNLTQFILDIAKQNGKFREELRWQLGLEG